MAASIVSRTPPSSTGTLRGNLPHGSESAVGVLPELVSNLLAAVAEGEVQRLGQRMSAAWAFVLERRRDETYTRPTSAPASKRRYARVPAGPLVV